MECLRRCGSLAAGVHNRMRVMASSGLPEALGGGCPAALLWRICCARMRVLCCAGALALECGRRRRWGGRWRRSSTCCCAAFGASGRPQLRFKGLHWPGYRATLPSGSRLMAGAWRRRCGRLPVLWEDQDTTQRGVWHCPVRLTLRERSTRIALAPWMAGLAQVRHQLDSGAGRGQAAHSTGWRNRSAESVALAGGSAQRTGTPAGWRRP